MDDSYIEPPPKNLQKGIKWLLVLVLFRVKKPFAWAAFLSMNPTIRSTLQQIIKPKYKDPETVDRRLRKLANLLTVSFLYSASHANTRIPKDYISLYLVQAYYGELDTPTSPIAVSSTASKYFKVNAYKEGGWARWLYCRKHYVIFPLLYAQLLSNYLTPTKYRLNQKYLSPFIKKRFLAPIWINFKLGVRFQSVSWSGLLASYIKHNLALFAYIAATSFRSRFLNQYHRLSSYSGPSIGSLVAEFCSYCAQRANAVANFIYEPNLLAMLLLSLTASSLTGFAPIRTLYLSDMKRTVKIYIKLVGFVAALSAMMLQSMKLFPAVAVGNGNDLTSDAKSSDARSLGPNFYNGINSYLAQLMVLSKWRILKGNHPWFTLLKVGTWQRMETGLMCFLVWKLMNLNDYIYRNQFILRDDEINRLKSNPWIKGINRIME